MTVGTWRSALLAVACLMLLGAANLRRGLEGAGLVAVRNALELDPAVAGQAPHRYVTIPGPPRAPTKDLRVLWLLALGPAALAAGGLSLLLGLGLTTRAFREATAFHEWSLARRVACAALGNAPGIALVTAGIWWYERSLRAVLAATGLPAPADLMVSGACTVSLALTLSTVAVTGLAGSRTGDLGGG